MSFIKKAISKFTSHEPKVIEESEEHIEEEHIEEEEEEEVSYDVFNKPIHIQMWNDIRVSYHALPVRIVVKNLSNWSYNRKLDEEHKNNIKESLKAQERPHLMGTIQVIRDSQGNCRVINGQHRLRALSEILKENLDPLAFQMEVMFEVYDLGVEDLDEINEDESSLIETLYKTANNSMNFNPEKEHDIICKKIIATMRKDPILKRGLVEKKDDAKVHKPRCLVKEMFEKFKEHFDTENNQRTVDEIVMRIKELNNKFANMPTEKFFGRKNYSKQLLGHYQKAEKYGFYLNIDGKYPPEVWIKMI